MHSILKNQFGRTLEISCVRANGDKIDEVFLQIGGSWHVVKVLLNSKAVDFKSCEDPFKSEFEIIRMPILTQFEGLRVHAINTFSNALGACGYEIKFSDFFEKALIVQSIDYCLYVGVANYIYKI